MIYRYIIAWGFYKFQSVCHSYGNIANIFWKGLQQGFRCRVWGITYKGIWETFVTVHHYIYIISVMLIA